MLLRVTGLCCSGKQRRFGSSNSYAQNLANPRFRACNFLGLLLFIFVIYVSGNSKSLAESVDKIMDEIFMFSYCF